MEFKLDEQKIHKIVASDPVFISGKELFKNNKVLKIEYTYDQNQKELLVFSEVLDGSKTYHLKLLFNANGELEKHSCSCHSIWRGVCKHAAASMFFIANEEETYVEKQIKSSISSSFIKKFQKRILSEVSQNKNAFKTKIFGGKVSFIPEITIIKTNIFLSFYIGNGNTRRFKIKNILNFYENTKKNQIFSYSKDFVFDHNMDDYDDTSKKTVEFLINEIDKQMEIKNSIVAASSEINKKLSSTFFSVTSKNLTNIFDLYKDSYLKIINNNITKIDLLVSLTKPDFNIRVKEKQNDIYMQIGNLPDIIFNSGNRVFLVFENEINEITSSELEIMKIISNTVDEHNNKLITFSDGDALKFKSFVLPLLKKYNFVTSDIDTKTNSINRFYFDFHNKEIVCEPKIFFSGMEFGLDFELEDYKHEQHFLKNLLEGFDFKYNSGSFVLEGEEDIYNFFVKNLAELEIYGEVFVSEEFKRQSKIPLEPKLNLNIKLESNILELNFDFEDYSVDELLETFNKYTTNRKFVRLESGKFINTSNDSFKEAYDFFSKMGLSKKDIKNNKAILNKYDAFFINDILNENNYFKLEKDNSFVRLVDDIKNYCEIEFKLPEDLENVLRNYQKQGFKWLKTLSHYDMGGILADDMGLGKTIQAIAFLVSEKEEGNQKPSLIICPTSLIYNWLKELKRFGSILSVEVINGLAGNRKELIKKSKSDVFLTTYDTLKRDLEYYDDKEFNVIIADEAQNIKNPTTQNAKAIKNIKSRCHFALTGTPIENSLTELWSIFDFILPGYLKSLTKFNKDFSKLIIKEKDELATARLKNKISPFILRRIKKDVLTELPDKIENIIYAEMTEEQRKVYLGFLYKAKTEVKKIKEKGEFSKSRIKILSLINRLRQICCEPSLFLEDYTGGSGKLSVTIETIDNLLESNHRILLFSQFTSMLSIIKMELDAKGIEYFYLDGSVSSAKRMEMTEAFNSGERKVFLISLKAGGTGLNLTGANVVIHYDPWWNPSIMDQATDRAHRIGQENVVTVLNIVTKDSIEEKIIELQNIKKELIDSVLEEGATFINKISTEEIEELFIM